MTPQAQKWISAGVGAAGVALVAMMVTVEGEPGLLPLCLVLLGSVGFATGWMRGRSRH